MRLSETFRTAGTTPPTAATVYRSEVSNIGAVSHFVLAMKSGTWQSGLATANFLAGCSLDMTLEGEGGCKIIDNMPLSILAAIADIEGGAVRYLDSAASASVTGEYICYMVLPIGNFVINDETVRVSLSTPANSFVGSAGFVLAYGFGLDGAETESGIWCLEKTDLAFTVALGTGTLEKQVQRSGVQAVYLHDPSSCILSWTIVPSDDRVSYGSRDLLRAWTLGTESLEIGVAVSNSSGSVDSWLNTYKVYDCDALTAHTSNATVRVQGNSILGNVGVVARYYEGRKEVSRSNVRELVKVADRATKLEQKNPQLAKILRHTGSVPKAKDARHAANVFSAKMRGN